jgi:hypothetical protein
MAGKKWNQRKTTSAKGTDTSPRRGEKSKQHRQNIEDETTKAHELQPSPAVTRNANKASTALAIEATETFQPKKLDHTFQSINANHDKDDYSNDSGSTDSEPEDYATTVLKKLQANPDGTTDSEDNNNNKTAYTSTKNKNTEKSNKKAHDDEQKAQRTNDASSSDENSNVESDDDDGMDPNDQNIDTYLLPSKHTDYTPAQANPYNKTTVPPTNNNQTIHKTTPGTTNSKSQPSPMMTPLTLLQYVTQGRKTPRPRAKSGWRHPTTIWMSRLTQMPHPPPPMPGDPIPIDNDCDCRYSVILSIPPSTEPWKVFTDLLKNFLKSIQEQTTKKLHITPWDPELAKDTPLVKKTSDFPEGSAKNRKKYATYFSGYPNPKRGKPSKVYLKVRFVTKVPADLPSPLTQLGQELSEGIAEEMTVTLAKNCYACQAVKVECIGWFFGSTKSIDSQKLVPATGKTLQIPAYVAIGLQWRTIKNENRKNYVWDEDATPPQALHIDIDHNYANRYT